MRLPVLSLWFLALVAATAAHAQPQPASPGYAIRALDGDQVLGEHFAVVPPVSTGTWVGFYYLADEQRLWVAGCSGTSCAPTRAINASGERGAYVSAAVRPAPSNLPIVAYYDVANGDLRLTACIDLNCSLSSVERTLDAAGDVGAGTAIAVDPATGLAVVAYHDVTNAVLKLYRCSVADCASGSAVVLDGTMSQRGARPSIAFGAGGALFVAYEDAGTGEVRLGRAVAPFTTLSSVPVGPGSEPALTVDGSGFADLVYRGPLDTLQRVRCTDATCSMAIQQTLAGAAQGFAPSAARTAAGNLYVVHQDQASNTVVGRLCNDAACSNPQVVPFETGAGLGGRSVALRYADGRPLALYRDANRADVRAAQCTTTACTTIVRRIAINGLPAVRARVVVRPDGRPLPIWMRPGTGLEPRLGVCADITCSSLQRRAIGGGNGDNSGRPAVAVRPDGRPFAFYSTFGGNQAWDCADSECTSGTARSVAGFGNASGQATELVLRADGRPVMAYVRASINDVFAFLCDDIDCTSGTERLLADEPSGSGESINHLSLLMGPGDRPVVMYARSGGGSDLLRYARCDDPACLTTSVRTVGTDPTFFGAPMALRADQRVAFLEFLSGSRNLGICADGDCSTVARFPLAGISDINLGLALLPGDRPVFDGGTIANGGYYRCSDATCTSFPRTPVIVDVGGPNRGFTGPVALNAEGQPVIAFDEQDLLDTWLAAPIPDRILIDGCE